MPDSVEKVDIKIKEFKIEDLPPSCTIICVGAPGSGKCLHPDTAVMMYDCSTKLAKCVKVGDKLMGDDSKSRTVLSVCTGTEEMFKIEQTNGETYTVNKSHILSLKRVYNPKKIINQDESCITIVWYMNNKKESRSFSYTETSFKKVEKESDRFLDSLVHGVDYTRENVLDVNITDYLSMSESEKADLKGYKCMINLDDGRYRAELYAYGLWLTSSTFDFSKLILSRLSILGVSVDDKYMYLPNGEKLGADAKREFPEDFLSSSSFHRGLFMTGIIDGVIESDVIYVDGSIKLCIDFSLMNKLVKLANSIGIYAKRVNGAVILKGRGLNKLPYNSENRVIFDSTDYSLSDIKVTSVGVGDYCGFEIDGNRRFVLGDCTVTHNTTFMNNVCYYLKHRYPVAKAFVGTEGGFKHFSSVFHPLYTSNCYDEEEEKRYVLRQKKCGMVNKQGQQDNYAINIVDDISDSKVYKTPMFKSIFKLGSQHWHQLFMMGSQYIIDLPPDIRKSVSYAVIFQERDPVDREKLYKNFGGQAGSYKNFCKLMDTICHDYTCLVFKKRTQDEDMEPDGTLNNIFYYKTQELPPWKFGCEEYRENAEERYNKNYVEKAVI